MGSFSIWHWLIVLVIVLVLFGGKGKLSSLMGDLGQGVKNFKKGLGGEEDGAAAGTTASGVHPKEISADTPAPAPQAAKDEAAKQ